MATTVKKPTAKKPTPKNKYNGDTVPYVAGVSSPVDFYGFKPKTGKVKRTAKKK